MKGLGRFYFISVGVVWLLVLALSIWVSYVPLSVGSPSPGDIRIRLTAASIDHEKLELARGLAYSSVVPPKVRDVSKVALLRLKTDVLTSLLALPSFTVGDLYLYSDLFGEDKTDRLVKKLSAVPREDYPLIGSLVYETMARILALGPVQDGTGWIDKVLSDVGVFSSYRDVVRDIVLMLVDDTHLATADRGYVESVYRKSMAWLLYPVYWVRRGEVIVKKGEILGEAKAELLRDAGYVLKNDLLLRMVEVVSLAILIAVGFYGLFLWRGRYRAKLLSSVPFVSAIWFLLMFLAVWYLPVPYAVFWVLWSGGVILMFAIYGTRTTLLTAIAVLAVLLWRISIPAPFVVFAVMMLFLLLIPLRSIRQGRAISTSLLLLVLYSLVATAGAYHYLTGDWVFSLYAGVASSAMLPIMVGVLVMLMPTLERRWHIITPFNLLRLMQPTHPLLRELSRRAPGTYQHSYAVAIMAQKAAEAVGADSLLTYVGALYHDVGKLYRPEYFIENLRPGDPNPHDSMSPYISAQRIKAHVKEGVKLIRKYRLPIVLEDFVRTHHGTSLVKYFYLKAKAMGEDIKEEDFRYPGPLPVSKETTIVMLADSIEAAVRSLPSHTREEIVEKIQEIFADRLADGQLRNSRLSFAEMEKVKSVFADVLEDMYHGRIRYELVAGGDKDGGKGELRSPDDSGERGEDEGGS